MPPVYERRAGWYLQQFIKIEACRAAKPHETVLIWDADTVPLQHLEFEDSEGRLIYYKGNDKPIIHPPYFDLIQKLLGLHRLRDISFISQSFPTRASWVHAMCFEIESKYSVDSWIDAVVANIDHNAGISGFSEYETLGTYISHHHAESYKFSDRNFFRNGTALIGSPASIHEPRWVGLKNCIDYIAFENYQTEKIRGISIGSGNAKAVLTPQGNAVINVDLEKYEEVDMIVDVEKTWPFPDAFFEQVIANNILEHVNDILQVMSEADRCLAVGGLLKIEVPFIGSYNHGTDVTHKRGLTYSAFNFLFADGRNYLYRQKDLQKYNYELVYFQRENIDNEKLVTEYLNMIPPLGTYTDWLEKVHRFHIPGTIGFMFRKLG
jgi:SAM-dependent methyltransferase